MMRCDAFMRLLQRTSPRFTLENKIIHRHKNKILTAQSSPICLIMGKKAKSSAGKKKAQERKIDKATLPPPPPKPEDEVRERLLTV